MRILPAAAFPFVSLVEKPVSPPLLPPPPFPSPKIFGPGSVGVGIVEIPHKHPLLLLLTKPEKCN